MSRQRTSLATSLVGPATDFKLNTTSVIQRWFTAVPVASLVLPAALLLSVPMALADELSTARAARDEANAKYFQELIKIPSPTVEDEKRLHSEHVAPAVGAVNTAVNKEREAANPKVTDPKTMFRKSTPSEASKKKERRAKMLKEINAVIEAKKKLPKGGETLTTSKPGKGIEQDSGPARPETVLDGSGIQRELEFSGKKAAPQPVKPTFKK